MNYVKLGRTGLDVSRICLGCMSYGDPNLPNQAWSLNERDSLPYFRQAIELGINFFDTANVYSLGASEVITGRALKEYARRDEIVLATKLYSKMREGPNGSGLSRKAVFQELDASLRRLGTDYVDLYQIHRWDDSTPIEETLEALNDVVRAGKVRYIGASSMFAWQFAQSLEVSRRHGWAKFVSMQNFVNLLYREEEREMLPLCKAEGIGVIPWSPLARGRLARANDAEATNRSEKDRFGAHVYRSISEGDRKIIDEVGRVAAARGISRAQVAMAWLLGKPNITAPIVGATKPAHLQDAVAALDVKLTEEEVTALEAHYVPHPVAGISW
ncbi:MAG: aldo/keto reductase [Proteobacteria bacterium]|nr:aldo/keto reductase [Pseudomonadota bacterium]